MCSGGRGRQGLSGTWVLHKEGSKCVLEGGAGQAEVSQCKAVESSFSEQVSRDLCFQVGRLGPHIPARCVWIRWATQDR